MEYIIWVWFGTDYMRFTIDYYIIYLALMMIVSTSFLLSETELLQCLDIQIAVVVLTGLHWLTISSFSSL